MIERRLGRGLESLIARTVATPEQRVIEIALVDIRPNPRQPRQISNEVALEGLAQSIKAHGVLQPIIVRRHDSGYELIAGERRFRASRIAGKDTIPALIVDAAELQSLELALIENIQREDLGVLEEAEAFQELLLSAGMTQQALADRMGRSRASVANTLRLLELPESVRQLIQEGRLSQGQAKAILAYKSKEDIVLIASEAAHKNWTVREIERRCRARLPLRRGAGRASGKTASTDAAPYVEQLRIIYGTKVEIDGNSSHGKITMEFYSAADLKRLVGLLIEAGLAADSAQRKLTRSPGQAPAADA